MKKNNNHAQIKPEQVWLPASKSIFDWDSQGFYKIMLEDKIRVDAYKNAITKVVKHGDIVLDLGTGTGILAKFALEAGASNVYGIEMSDVGKIAEKNFKKDFPDKFKLIKNISYKVSLPGKADVVLSEIIGNLGDNENLCEILNDAQKRFLKRGGKMLPLRVETFLCPVSSRLIHKQIESHQFKNYPGCKPKKIGNPFNSYYDSLIPKKCEMAVPSKSNTFNFNGKDEVSYKKELEFKVLKNSLFTGFKGYFNAKLSTGINLDISGETIGKDASSSWQHAYLPISNPFNVEKGDKIRLNYERKSKDGMSQPSYFWEGEVYRGRIIVHTFKQYSKS